MTGVLIAVIGGGLFLAVIVVLGVGLAESVRYAVSVVRDRLAWRRKVRQARDQARRYGKMIRR